MYITIRFLNDLSFHKWNGYDDEVRKKIEKILNENQNNVNGTPKTGMFINLPSLVSGANSYNFSHRDLKFLDELYIARASPNFLIRKIVLYKMHYELNIE